jgi:hypothetical protein
MKTLKLITTVLAGAFFISCSNTKIVSSWKAENTVTKPYHNIMIWGILTEKDSALRRNMEAHLMNDLIDKGYHAVSSMEVYGAKAFTKQPEKEIVDEFRNTGVDAVVTIVLLSKEKEDIYMPARTAEQPARSFDQFDKYYTDIFDRIYSPGYYSSTTRYLWEVNFFEVDAKKQIYSVRTKSFDPSSAESLAHANGVMILKDMLRKKLIVDHYTELQSREK